jgi:hypothetical protein
LPSCFQYMLWCGWYTSFGTTFDGVFFSFGFMNDSFCYSAGCTGLLPIGFIRNASNSVGIVCAPMNGKKGLPTENVNISRNIIIFSLIHKIIFKY